MGLHWPLIEALETKKGSFTLADSGGAAGACPLKDPDSLVFKKPIFQKVSTSDLSNPPPPPPQPPHPPPPPHHHHLGVDTPRREILDPQLIYNHSTVPRNFSLCATFLKNARIPHSRSITGKVEQSELCRRLNWNISIVLIKCGD